METEFLPICTSWQAELVLDAIDDIDDLLHRTCAITAYDTVPRTWRIPDLGPIDHIYHARVCNFEDLVDCRQSVGTLRVMSADI